MHKHTAETTTQAIDMTGFVPIPGLPGYLVHPDGCVVSLKKESPRILSEHTGGAPVWWRTKIGRHDVRTRDLVHIMFGSTAAFEERAWEHVAENYIEATILQIHEADVARAPEILEAIFTGQLTDEMLDTVCELPGRMLKTWRHLTVAEVVFMASENGFNAHGIAEILKTSGAVTLEGYWSFVANARSQSEVA